MLKKFLIGTFVALAVMVASTAFAADFGTTTLRVGSKGEAVKAVQTLVGATADGSFGPLTAAKVKVWQAANSLTADGVFGAMSKAKANAGSTVVTSSGCPAGALFNSLTGASCTTVTSSVAGCAAGAAFSSTTGAACGTTTVTTTGQAGDLTLTSTTADVETSAPEGVSTKVLGMKAEATSSDIAISNVKVQFVLASGTGSTRLDHYASQVDVYMGGTKIGSALVSDFTKNGTTYSTTIPVSAIVKVGTANKANFYVAITPVSSLDSADAGSGHNSWTATINAVRYTDGTGLTLSQDQHSTVTHNFIFDKLTTSGNLKLTVSESGNPVAGNIMVSDTGSTADILLNKFTMKVEGSDMTMSTLSATIGAAGTGTAAQIAQNLTLKANDVQIAEIDSVLGAANTPTTNVFTLDNDLVMKAGTTTTFAVYAKVNKIGAGSFAQGDSLTATYLTAAVETTGTGSSFTSSIKGSSVGNAQTFRSTGIMPTLVSTNVSVAKGLASKPDLGTYSITFDVTAFGADMYIDKQAPVVAVTTANQLAIAGGAGTLTAVITSPNATEKTNSFFVAQGTTQRFTITAVVTPSVGGLSAVKLAAIRYAVTDVAGTLTYNSNLISFITPYQNLVLSN